MRFGIKVHVIEAMISLGMGMWFSQFLQDGHDSQTDTVMHGAAAVGVYCMSKMLYNLAQSARQRAMGEVNADELRPLVSQKNKI